MSPLYKKGDIVSWKKDIYKGPYEIMLILDCVLFREKHQNYKVMIGDRICYLHEDQIELVP